MMNPAWIAYENPPGPPPQVTYSLFSVNGPVSSQTSTAPIVVGVLFKVTQPGLSLLGYRWWIADAGESTTPQQFALWTTSSISGGVFQTGSLLTSGTMTLGWNYIPYGSPISLTSGTEYKATTGTTANFPVTQFQFGTAGPYINGITNGPLFAWSAPSGNGGTNPDTFGSAQGSFSSPGDTNPSHNYPQSDFNSSNFWIDVVVG